MLKGQMTLYVQIDDNSVDNFVAFLHEIDTRLSSIPGVVSVSVGPVTELSEQQAED